MSFQQLPHADHEMVSGAISSSFMWVKGGGGSMKLLSLPGSTLALQPDRPSQETYLPIDLLIASQSDKMR